MQPTISKVQSELGQAIAYAKSCAMTRARAGGADADDLLKAFGHLHDAVLYLSAIVAEQDEKKQSPGA